MPYKPMNYALVTGKKETKHYKNTTMKETAIELLELIGVPQTAVLPQLETLIQADAKYVRDLKVNVGNVLVSEHISIKETALLALSVASNAKNQVLIDGFTRVSKQQEATEAEIAEAIACASLLASNNVFYRFRHFMGKESYNNQPGKIRMNIMMKPVLGKEFFELMSLVISAVNGCELCVTSHEASLITLGTTEQRVWDAVRLGAVITSLDRVIY